MARKDWTREDFEGVIWSDECSNVVWKEAKQQVQCGYFAQLVSNLNQNVLH